MGGGFELRRASLAQSRWWWASVSMITALVLTALLLAVADDRKAVLELELAFSGDACCSWQVWVNDGATEDITVFEMRRNGSGRYSIPLEVERIKQLRMPLGEAPGGTVTLGEIRVRSDGRTVDRVTPAELDAMFAFDLERRVTPDGIVFEATGRHPFLDARVDLETGSGPLALAAVKLLDQPLDALVALLLVGTFAIVALGLRTSWHALWAGALLATILGVYALPSLLAQIPFHDDVSASVGFASYVGVSKARDVMLLNAAALLAVAVPLAAAAALRVARRRGRSATGADTVPSAPATPLRPAFRALAVAVPVGVAALVGAPRLGETLGYARVVEYIPNWDSNNFLFWRYLIQTTDQAPVADFLWLYGLQWLFHLPSPWGDWISFVAYMAIWAAIAAGSWLTLSRFFDGPALVGRFAALSAFWVTALLAGYASFEGRYAAAVGVLLLYTAIRPHERLLSPRRALFAAAFAGLALFELAQAIYTVLPIAALLALELATEVERRRDAVARWLGRVATTLGAPALAAVATMAAFGMLGNTAFYYAELRNLTVTFAYPAATESWVRNPFFLAALLFWCVPVTLALGSWGVAAAATVRARRIGGVVLALGLLGFMVMQKQFVRPDVSGQIWLPIVFGLPFWAVTETTLGGRRRWATIGAVAGAGAALILVTGGLERGWDRLEAGPGRLASSLEAVVRDGDEFALDRDARFSQERFTHFPRHRAVATVLRDVPAVRAGGDVWILGDDSAITILLGHDWPYYFFDLYDASPIAFQRRVLERLDESPPVRVVWNYAPEALVFDSVPHVVRSPLLFEWTIRNYVPERELEQFAILRPRGTGEPPALAWWRERLGKNVNLGHVPRSAGLPDEPCDSDSDCGTFLLVEPLPGTTLPDQVVASLRVGGLDYEVQFATRPGTERFVVPLDRVWFWSASPPGYDRELVAGVPGTRSELVRRRRDPDVLY